jgi:hypothetical protein
VFVLEINEESPSKLDDLFVCAPILFAKFVIFSSNYAENRKRAKA